MGQADRRGSLTQAGEHGTLAPEPKMLARLYNLAGKVLFYGGIVWVICMARKGPRMLSPPFIPEDLEQATYAEMRRYVTYLKKTCRHLSKNEHLEPEDRDLAASRADYLADVLTAHPLLDDLVRTIDESETRVVFPLLDKLSLRAPPPSKAAQPFRAGTKTKRRCR